MKTIGFVIVQYNNWKDTINCVSSIKKTMKDQNYKICIVDNQSPNNSYENINTYYINDEKIIIVESKQNLGYANGGNLGVHYLLENFDADLLCILNNDIIFETEDLLATINQTKKTFDILAPNIIRQDGCPQNPQPDINYSLSWINLYMFVYYILYILHRLYLDFIPYLLAVIVMGKYYTKHKEAYKDEQYIAKSHGSCIFFTRNFVEHFHRAPMHHGTFLFLEEDFLALRCKNENKKILFNENLKVLHLEDHSMDSIFHSKRNKRIFVYKNHIESFKSFKQYYLILKENKINYNDNKEILNPKEVL